MPGPIDACARSTGATLPCWSAVTAVASSRLSAAMKSLRETAGASTGRGRHTRTIEDASAFEPLATIRLPSSLRMGHVPVTAKPAPMSASSIVSEPVDATDPSPPSVSVCLNA